MINNSSLWYIPLLSLIGDTLLTWKWNIFVVLLQRKLPLIVRPHTLAYASCIDDRHDNYCAQKSRSESRVLFTHFINAWWKNLITISPWLSQIMCDSLYQNILLLSQHLEEEEELQSCSSFAAELIPAEWHSFSSFLQLVSWKTQDFWQLVFLSCPPKLFRPLSDFGCQTFHIESPALALRQTALAAGILLWDSHFKFPFLLTHAPFWCLKPVGPFWWQITDVLVVRLVPVS